jgi:hypothetical protein
VTVKPSSPDLVESARKILNAQASTLADLEVAEAALSQVRAETPGELDGMAERRREILASDGPAHEVDKQLERHDAAVSALTRRSEVAAAISTKVATRLSAAREAAAEAARQARYDQALELHNAASSRVREFLDRVAPEAREVMQVYAAAEAATAAANRDRPAGESLIPSIEQRRTGELQTRETVVRRLRYFYQGNNRIVEVERGEALPTGDGIWNVFVPSNSSQGGLAARDLALGKNPVGLAAAGNEYAAQNPIAALGALRTSIEQFGAALTAGPVQQAGAQLVSLAQHITEAAAAVEKFETDHPVITKNATTGAEVVGGVLGLGLAASGAKRLAGKALGGLGLGWLFGGGGAAAGAVAGAETGAETGSLLGPWGTVGGAVVGGAAGALGLEYLWKNRDSVFGSGRPYGPQLPADWSPHPSRAWTPSGVALSGGADNAKLSAASAMPVNVSGQADINQQLTIRVDPSPWFKAMVDQALQNSQTLVPLIGGGAGAMDSDAGPHRSGPGGIGSR